MSVYGSFRLVNLEWNGQLLPSEMRLVERSAWLKGVRSCHTASPSWLSSRALRALSLHRSGSISCSNTQKVSYFTSQHIHFNKGCWVGAPKPFQMSRWKIAGFSLETDLQPVMYSGQKQPGCQLAKEIATQPENLDSNLLSLSVLEHKLSNTCIVSVPVKMMPDINEVLLNAWL